MAKQKKLPAMQFYTGDWMKDPALRGVSLAAKGLWMDMLCLMHESDRRGYLLSNGKPISQDKLARMTGSSSKEVSQCLGELEDSGVYSCTEHGCIYSRRMVRDEERRKRAKDFGKLGGNPALRSNEVKGEDKGRDKGEVNLKSRSSVSSSTSVDLSLTTPKKTEIPESLLEAARIISLMPECQVDALRLDYQDDWIEPAIKDAVLKKKRNWNYVRAILQNWKREGGPPDNDNNTPRNNGSRQKPHATTGSGGVKKGKYAAIDAMYFGTGHRNGGEETVS